MKKCKECGQTVTPQISDMISWIIGIFIFSWILQICINFLGQKYSSLPVLTYWDVFAGCFIFRFLFKGIEK